MRLQDTKGSSAETTKEKYPIKLLLVSLSLLLVLVIVVVGGTWHDHGAEAGVVILVWVVIVGIVAFYDLRRKWKRKQEKARKESRPDFFQGGGI